MDNYSVYFGAVGWNHEPWRNDFYPQDLPEDWQLAFYNTQFRCVYLPCQFWRDASDEQVAAWLNDTQDGFRFVLQQPETMGEGALRLAERFGGRGVFEDRVELVWLEGEPDLRDLAQRMQKSVQRGAPLFLISRDGLLRQLRQVNELIEVLGA